MISLFVFKLHGHVYIDLTEEKPCQFLCSVAMYETQIYQADDGFKKNCFCLKA